MPLAQRDREHLTYLATCPGEHLGGTSQRAIAAVLAEIDRLGEANAALLAACEATVAKYERLYRGMDPEYAAFFTAMGPEVETCRAAIAQARTAGGSEEAKPCA